MRIAKHVGVATVMLMLSVMSFSQQLRLGKSSFALQKSAILELESDNQGLLFPRITDTSLINTLTPPDGMVIYHQPSAQLMLRSGGYWKPLTSANLLSNLWSINGNSNGSVKSVGNIDNFDLSVITNNTERMRILANGNVGIGTNTAAQKLDVNGNMNLSGAFMPGNNAGTSGYILRSNGAGAAPSWTNPLLSGLADVTITSPANGQLLQYNGTKWINTTPSFLTTIDTTNISNFYIKVRSLLTAAAPLTFSNGQFGITQATTSANGYLSSTDWNTFNNKLSTIDTSNISNFYKKVRGLLSAGTGISYNNNTGVIANSGVLSLNGFSGAVAMDTTFITNFYTKARASFSAVGPLTYSNGQYGIPVASGSANGYLSSADWTTFNNKLSSIDTTSIPNFSQKVRGLLSGGTGISYNNNTGVITNSGVTSLNGNSGALTMDTSYINNFFTKARASFSATGPLTYSNGQYGIPVASGSANGYLSSADWTTFNNKLSSIDTTSIPNFSQKVRGLLSGGTGISYNSSTGVIANSGVLSLNGFSGAVSMDTTFIANFYTKARASFSAGAPLTYANGQFNIPKATTVVNGYLSSADWTTFNSKLSSVDTISIPNFAQKVRSLHSAGAGISYNATAGAIANSGVLSINGNTGALTMDSSYINNFHLKVKSLFSAGTGITYDPVTGQISSTASSTTWGLTGNANTVAGTSFLGTTDDKPLVLKSNGSAYAELGRRQTLGLVQTYTDYTDPDEQIFHVKSALQFYAPSALFYKPKIYVDANGNFRTKGSSAGTDYFEFGSTGTNNDGGFEFIIGDDGDEPIVFKSYNYLSGMSEMMRLQSGRMAIGSNAFNATNPEKLLVDAGVTNSYNLMTGKGSINNYLQINVQNQSNGNTASSDIVATADNGDESNNYIDMGINSSGFTNSAYPVLSGINNAYLYTTGNDFILGNATASKNIRFFTGGYATTNERLRIDGTGKVGIGTTTPSSILHIKSGTTDVSGVRMENLTSASATTSGAATLGVDATGNIVRAKAPVYYTGGVGGTATVDGITKVWVAEVTNTASGTQTITIPTNVVFTNIIGITLTAKGGTDATNSPVPMVTSNTTTQIVIRVLESKLTTVVFGGNVEGMEAHTNTSTKIYVRVEGN